MIASADVTFGALADVKRASSARSSPSCPPTEAQATRTLRVARPLLADATLLLRDAAPGTRLLPTRDAAARPRDRHRPARAAPRAHAGRRPRRTRCASVETLSRDPATTTHAPEARRDARRPPGRSSTTSRRCRRSCNYLGLWTRNANSAISEGDANGNWFRTLAVIATRRSSPPRPSPRPSLHVNPYPHTPRPARTASARPATRATSPGPQIGNPPGNQGTATEPTDADAGRGAAVSLRAIDRTPEWVVRRRGVVAASSWSRSLPRASAAAALAERLRAEGGRHVRPRAVRRARRCGSPASRSARSRRSSAGPGNTAIVTMAIKDVGLPIHEDATLKVRPRIFLEGNFFVDLKPGTPHAPDGRTRAHDPDRADRRARAVRRGAVRRCTSRRAGSSSAFVDQLSRVARRRRRRRAVAHVHAVGPRVHARGDRARRRCAARRATTSRASSAARRRRRRAIASRDAPARHADRRPRAHGHRAGQPQRPARGVAAAARRPGRRGARRAARGRRRRCPRPARSRSRRGRRCARRRPRCGSRCRCSRRRARSSRPASCPPCSTSSTRRSTSSRPLEPRLTALLDGLTPVIDCLRNNAMPTLKTPLVDPPHTTGDCRSTASCCTANVGLASASQNFDGNGPAVRYHAGFGDQLVTTGSVPTVGEALVGTTSEPLIGSRPKKPAAAAAVPLRRRRATRRSRRTWPPQTGPAPQQRKVKLKAAP